MAEGKVKNLLRLSRLRDKYDAFILATHACLVEKGFRCIGCGEERNSEEEFDFGETLPPGWNRFDDIYALQYRQGTSGTFYFFKALRLGNMIAIYLMEEDESKVQDTTFNVDDFTSNEMEYNTLDQSPQMFNRAFKQLQQLKAKINKEIVDKFKSERTTSHRPKDENQRIKKEKRQQPRSILQDDPPHFRPRQPPDFRDEWSPPEGTFPTYGDGDRFPGHPGGGGMIMDPFRSGDLPTLPGTSATPPGQLPRGSVPPGARFDPFGPVPPGGSRGDRRSGPFAGPDPDHLPPPGYDDMFM